MVRAKTMVIGMLCAVGPGLALGGYGELGDAHVYQETCSAGLNRVTDPAGDPAPEAVEASTACLGFTAGVVAGYGAGWPAGATGALALQGELDTKAYDRLRLTETHCFPGRLPVDQIVRRVLLRLKYHPAEFALPTVRLIASAGCYTR